MPSASGKGREGLDSAMVHGLIVTHGRLAEELLAAANRIEGPLEGVEAVCLDWQDGVETAHTRSTR
jgi:mannose/fructose-specific phosphotransferase system component IIA